MLRTTLFAALLASTPALAEEDVPYDLAISRLRACILSGTDGVQAASLQQAIVTVRSLCQAQINRVYAASDARIAASQTDPDARKDEQAKARHRIDFELATVVSNRTGLLP